MACVTGLDNSSAERGYMDSIQWLKYDPRVSSTNVARVTGLGGSSAERGYGKQPMADETRTTRGVFQSQHCIQNSALPMQLCAVQLHHIL